MTIPLQAVFFDLDGTLIDSAPDLVTATNKTLIHFNVAPRTPEEIKSFIGQGLRELIRQSVGAEHESLVEEVAKQFMAYYDLHLADQTRLYPGVRPLLEKLKPKVKIFMLTNKNEAFTLKLIKHFQLEHYFDGVFGGDTFHPRKKPDPVAIESVYPQCRTRALGLAMVGDSWVDVETGRNAHARTLMHRHGYARPGELEKAKPDFIYNDARELEKYLNG